MNVDPATAAWAAYIVLFELFVLYVFVHAYRLAPSPVETHPARCVECRGKIDDPEGGG